MQFFLFAALALIAGALLTFQAGFNAQLGKAVDSAFYGAFLSFIIGSVGLAIFVVINGVDFSRISETKNLSLGAWTGGLIGAFYVVSMIYLAPRLGTSLAFGLVISGQMILALIADHYGWMDLPVLPVSWTKILGVALIICGVFMIKG